MSGTGSVLVLSVDVGRRQQRILRAVEAIAPYWATVSLFGAVVDEGMERDGGIMLAAFL